MSWVGAQLRNGTGLQALYCLGHPLTELRLCASHPVLPKFNLFGGLLLLLLCCAVFPRKRAERNVARTGLLVPVQIVRVECNPSAAFRFVHFTFQGQKHSLKVGQQDCEQLYSGQTLQLQHLDSQPDIFLFPGSYSSSESFSWGALFLLGCYTVGSSLQRLRKEST